MCDISCSLKNHNIGTYLINKSIKEASGFSGSTRRTDEPLPLVSVHAATVRFGQRATAFATPVSPHSSRRRSLQCFSRAFASSWFRREIIGRGSSFRPAAIMALS